MRKRRKQMEGICDILVDGAIGVACGKTVGTIIDGGADMYNKYADRDIQKKSSIFGTRYVNTTTGKRVKNYKPTDIKESSAYKCGKISAEVGVAVGVGYNLNKRRGNQRLITKEYTADDVLSVTRSNKE